MDGERPRVGVLDSDVRADCCKLTFCCLTLEVTCPEDDAKALSLPS